MALRMNDLREVRNFLFGVRLKWYNLGLEVKVAIENLDQIEGMKLKDPGDSLREMLKIRLKNVNNPLTWKMLADALRAEAIDELELAEKCKLIYASTIVIDCMIW